MDVGQLEDLVQNAWRDLVEVLRVEETIASDQSKHATKAP